MFIAAGMQIPARVRSPSSWMSFYCFCISTLWHSGFKQGVHSHERPSMIHVSPRRAYTVREWIGVLASFCLSKTMSLQGVAGSRSPYMEAFSGAWLQACMAAASTHCGVCPWLQFCKIWGREFIDALSYVSQSLSIHEFTENLQSLQKTVWAQASRTQRSSPLERSPGQSTYTVAEEGLGTWGMHPSHHETPTCWV